MQYRKGQRVALVHTDDPYTHLRPGHQGTVLRHDTATDTIYITWDSGSTLAICPDAGDRIRLLDSEPGERHRDTAEGEPKLADCLVELAADLGFTLEPRLDRWLEACAEDPAPVLGVLTAGLQHAATTYTYRLASTSYDLLGLRVPGDVVETRGCAPQLAALERCLDDLTGQLARTGAAYESRLKELADSGGSALVRRKPTR